MKGSIKRYCFCKDPATGRDLGTACVLLKTDTKHGEWEYRDRHMTTIGYRVFRRRGFPTKKAAGAFRTQVYDLLALAKGDAGTLARVGDLVFDKTRRGGHLPPVDDLRRRLGVGQELDRSQTVGEWLEQWYAGKKRAKRDSTLRSYRQHLDHYLIPQLGHLPLDRLNALHISDLFDLIEEWNTEIRTARAEGRRPAPEGDVRKRSKVVSVATQRRVYATLRNALNVAMKQKPARLIDYNPCDMVEMPDEHRDRARTWDPDQVGQFIAHTADDPLGTLYRLVLLHGPRRGEAVGARWSGHDHGERLLCVQRPLLQLGGKLVESTPKTRAGERVLFLDVETNDEIKKIRTQQARNRLKLGAAYEDNDLIFCWPDGKPYAPDWVSRRFKTLAVEAGLPPIKLHEGRHTAATLRLEAGVEIKVVSEQMGHSKTAITQDLYQHVRRAMLDKATEAVVRLLPDRKRRDEQSG